MVPEKADTRTFWEHIYRYRFAAPRVKGKKVLDIACGEGYGAAGLLRAGAASVVGVDISAELCEHAARRYGITARVGDAQNIPLPASSVEVAVSFETIEHLPQPEKFLDECVRVLAPGGKLIISTPNREVYRELCPANPYHVQELSRAEFIELLLARFGTIELFTQRPLAVAWWTPCAWAAERTFWQKLPGFGCLQRRINPEICDAAPATRENPVAAILKKTSLRSRWANPYVLRPERTNIRERPVYFLAVATRR